MDTLHSVFYTDSCTMEALKDESVDLVVTSPPYPMIEMWDASFSAVDPAIDEALQCFDGNQAFDRMHAVLEKTWREILRVLKPGGMACVNIGDATRSLNGSFQLYPNHVVTVSLFRNLGFAQLPAIIWRKPTNAPTKFMGSGMFPPGAYVTLEHEYILIFRKGDRREFTAEAARQERHESAYFWEERNIWFSDVWLDLVGAQQSVNGLSSRSRSGAFPLELPYRLIHMFSIRGDTVLDPFAGTGTTTQAAMCAQRNSVAYEKDVNLQSVILQKISSVPDLSQELTQKRLKAHRNFVRDQVEQQRVLKYRNRHYEFPVMTRQEEDLRVNMVLQVEYLSTRRYKARYVEPNKIWPKGIDAGQQESQSTPCQPKATKNRQLRLF